MDSPVAMWNLVYEQKPDFHIYGFYFVLESDDASEDDNGNYSNEFLEYICCLPSQFKTHILNETNFFYDVWSSFDWISFSKKQTF